MLLIARNSNHFDSSPCRHFSRRESQQTRDISLRSVLSGNQGIYISTWIFDVLQLLFEVILSFKRLSAMKFGMKWALFAALWSNGWKCSPKEQQRKHHLPAEGTTETNGDLSRNNKTSVKSGFLPHRILQNPQLLSSGFHHNPAALFLTH